jgi:hypothetical protein
MREVRLDDGRFVVIRVATVAMRSEACLQLTTTRASYKGRQRRQSQHRRDLHLENLGYPADAFEAELRRRKHSQSDDQEALSMN